MSAPYTVCLHVRQGCNDNNIYTELAREALVELEDRVLLFFAGENTPPLNNSATGSYFNAPRNIGFVSASSDVRNKTIFSEGPTEVGGFHDYGGRVSCGPDSSLLPPLARSRPLCPRC